MRLRRSGLEQDLLYEQLLSGLAQLEFSTSRLRAMEEAHAAEQREYERICGELEAAIAHTQTKIGENRLLLEVERENLRNRQEYDTLARMINEHRPRRETNASIRELEAELQRLDDEHAALQSRLALRRKQFNAFIQAIAELQLELQTADGAPAVAAGPGEPDAAAAPVSPFADDRGRRGQHRGEDRDEDDDGPAGAGAAEPADADADAAAMGGGRSGAFEHTAVYSLP